MWLNQNLLDNNQSECILISEQDRDKSSLKQMCQQDESYNNNNNNNKTVRLVCKLFRRVEGGGHSFMASSKSSVFKFFLKHKSELLNLQWLPRLFQTDGAAQLNPRMAPEVRTNGFSRRRPSQDRSWRPAREIWSLRSSYRYLGSALHRTLYVITAILNLIRCSIGSQCSWMSDGLASLDQGDIVTIIVTTIVTIRSTTKWYCESGCNLRCHGRFSLFSSTRPAV